MTRFQRLAAARSPTTFLLVTIGVIVRVTDSGLGCPDWPFCYGQLLPPAGDFKAWIEWVHRTVAALIGFLILGMAAVAVLDHRDRPSILWPSLVAVGLVAFQAYLGRETVRLGNSGESVTAHLAAAMGLVGILVFLLVRASYPVRIGGRGGSQRFTLLAAFGAASTFVLLLFGSNVTARNAGLVFLDWPLMSGGIYPFDPSTPGDVAVLYAAHALHRYVAAAVFVVLLAVAVAARRTQGARPGLRGMAIGIFALYVVQVDRRRVAGPHEALRLVADAPPGARRAHLGRGRRARGRDAGVGRKLGKGALINLLIESGLKNPDQCALGDKLLSNQPMPMDGAFAATRVDSKHNETSVIDCRTGPLGPHRNS